MQKLRPIDLSTIFLGAIESKNGVDESQPKLSDQNPVIQEFLSTVQYMNIGLIQPAASSPQFHHSYLLNYRENTLPALYAPNKAPAKLRCGFSAQPGAVPIFIAPLALSH